MSGSIPTSPATPMVSPGLRLPALSVPLQQLPSSPSVGAMQPPGSPRSTSGLSGDRSDHSGLMSAPHFSLSSAHSRDDFESTPLHSFLTPGHSSSGRSNASSAVQNREDSFFKYHLKVAKVVEQAANCLDIASQELQNSGDPLVENIAAKMEICIDDADRNLGDMYHVMNLQSRHCPNDLPPQRISPYKERLELQVQDSLAMLLFNDVQNMLTQLRSCN